MTVAANVNAASAMLGTLLVLLTLFTSELARRYGNVQSGPDCSRSDRWQLISASVAVALITACSFISLGWVAVPAIESVGTRAWDPTFVVLLLIWLLLLPLFAWQFLLARSARALRVTMGLQSDRHNP
ncbi:MAG: hypothetical protein WA751_06140 [Candidatus Dormiibacterota bacterium]